MSYSCLCKQAIGKQRPKLVTQDKFKLLCKFEPATHLHQLDLSLSGFSADERLRLTRRLRRRITGTGRLHVGVVKTTGSQSLQICVQI